MHTAAKQASTLLQLRCLACGCTYSSSSPAWPGGLLSSMHSSSSLAWPGGLLSSMHSSSSLAWPGGLLSSRNANCSSAHMGACEEEQVWVSACTIQAGGVAGGPPGFCALGPPHGSMLGCIASSLNCNQSTNQSVHPSINPSDPVRSINSVDQLHADKLQSQNDWLHHLLPVLHAAHQSDSSK